MRSAWERRLCRPFMPALPEHCPVFWEGHCGGWASRAIGSTTAGVVRCRCGSAAVAITATFIVRVSVRGSAGASLVVEPQRAINVPAVERIVMPPGSGGGGYVGGKK